MVAVYMEKKKRITGSFAAKVIAFFLLTASAFTVTFSGLVAVKLMEDGYYTDDMAAIFLRESRALLLDEVYEVKKAIEADSLEHAEAVCEGKNFDVALMEADDAVLPDEKGAFWTTYDGSYPIDASMTQDFILQFSSDNLKRNAVVHYRRIYSMKDYAFRVYIDAAFPAEDELRTIYENCSYMKSIKYFVLWILGISAFVGFNSFLFLMCSAGHSNEADGIQPSVFTSIPLELHSAVFGIAALILLILLENITYDIYDSVFAMAVFSAGMAALALWCTFYLRELATRMKLGGWWRNTIIYYMLKLLRRSGKLLWNGICAMLKGFPLILNILLLFFGICILEFIGVCIYVRANGAVLWLLEKLILLPAVVYAALMCKKLLKGSEALAQGRQEEIVDTKYMFGDFKECGENLNSIGQGISKAVAERMKSEHLKTELITNVSHDIKTPLTSIINYANLIAEEPSENEKITEYSEVLVRQSGRLKKLLEDLVEASKATTGNMEVKLQPCEVSVILSQAIGEYQQRMDEKQLELIVTQPEEPLKIMADGRHLWRVFDNLLNNICKYAREDSRVYLSVEQKDNRVNIIFRNMSKYALNIGPEELQERFVRGDKARHIEGNGLGLSIAKSLTELQNGRMDIVTDGDLFKVNLSFNKI